MHNCPLSNYGQKLYCTVQEPNFERATGKAMGVTLNVCQQSVFVCVTGKERGSQRESEHLESSPSNTARDGQSKRVKKQADTSRSGVSKSKCPLKVM